MLVECGVEARSDAVDHQGNSIVPSRWYISNLPLPVQYKEGDRNTNIVLLLDLFSGSSFFLKRSYLLDFSLSDGRIRMANLA